MRGISQIVLYICEYVESYKHWLFPVTKCSQDFPSDDQFSPKNDIYLEFSSHYLQYPGQPHVVVDVDHGGLVVDGPDVPAVLG